MDIKTFLTKERIIWHDRFVPSMIAAVAVLIITFILQFSGFDIVLLTSISASLVILTSQKLHHLTILGTAIYSYILASVVGFSFLLLKQSISLSIITTSFITIITISILIYMFDIVHPPSVGIALGIIYYSGSVFNLIFTLVITLIMFIIVKIIMYLYYDHLKIKFLHHEFLIWKKKFLRK